MSEFNYFKEKRRMVESIGGYLDDMYCDGLCENCPLASHNRRYTMCCTILEMKHPEEAEAIVRKWAEEHPAPQRKTRKDVLLEKFPNAKRYCASDTPSICAYSLGLVDEEEHEKCYNTTCAECWNKEVEKNDKL